MSSFPSHQVLAVVEVAVGMSNTRRKNKEICHLPHLSEICEVTLREQATNKILLSIVFIMGDLGSSSHLNLGYLST